MPWPTCFILNVFGGLFTLFVAPYKDLTVEESFVKMFPLLTESLSSEGDYYELCCQGFPVRLGIARRQEAQREKESEREGVCVCVFVSASVCLCLCMCVSLSVFVCACIHVHM